MTPLTTAEQRVLKKITPHATDSLVQDTLNKVRKHTTAEVMLGGSTAKGTHLQGDHDIDVFVRYPQGTPSIADRLEQELTAALKHVERVHGSRDYFHVTQKEYTFEFVPVLAIASWKDAENVTDMSPLHVEYTKRHIHEHPELADHIRLAKQFMKAQRVYGAESYIGGFSGHVVELLVIHYTSFRALLQNAAAWPDRVTIDHEQQLTNPEEELNESKTFSPLIIVDPVQPTRNAAAAVSQETFSTFKRAAAEYVHSDNPEEFFDVTPLTVEDMRMPRGKVIEVVLEPLKGKRDVVGAKCYKVFEYLERQLRLHHFRLLKTGWEFTKEQASLFFTLDNEPLEPELEVTGPPSELEDDAVRFREVHEHTYEREGRLFAREKRKFTEASTLISFCIEQHYVLSRIKTAEVIDHGTA